MNTTSLEGETISINSAIRTDYAGNRAYLDFQSGTGVVRQFEPGMAMIDSDTTEGGADTMYYHTDHLGTTRLMSDASGYAATGWHSTGGGPTDVTPSVFTAFGEPITGPLDGESNRYGYVGAHGYQAHGEMPYLHVGHRYYDPSSGRFLQRDPIGIRGGLAVFGYAHSMVTVQSDPMGLMSFSGKQLGGAVAGGATAGAVRGGLAGSPLGPAGTAAGVGGGALLGGTLGGVTYCTIVMFDHAWDTTSNLLDYVNNSLDDFQKRRNRPDVFPRNPDPYHGQDPKVRGDIRLP